jgi:Acyclic terpene utilisation family protein AtuA
MSKSTVRIGGASGFWGDSSVGAPQLVEMGNIDYLVFDYLAELTMSLLAAAKMKNPDLGYATDFVSSAMASVLPMVVSKNIRVISNAGGVNPRACASALEKLAASMNLKVNIAVVTGDDALLLMDDLRASGVGHMVTGQAMPPKLLSANAYFGALPIASALEAGAQIVITGRCVDSAVTLGALIHEFKWSANDWDRLAGASLAGHIIECGCQATGGLHTDWQDVPDWAHIGYPIVECLPDGSFTVSKPEGTGGLVSPATVGEQLLYEIGDPGAYLLPDVTCDFRYVTIDQVGPDSVYVKGAKGRAPSNQYKVTATYPAGYRCNADLLITGFDAAGKAKRSGEAILIRTREMLKVRGFADFIETHLDIIGAEQSYGPVATVQPPRQAVMRLAVTHSEKAALELFAREIFAAGTSWAPGTTGMSGGRPSPSLSIRQFPLLMDKALFTPSVQMQGKSWMVPVFVSDAPTFSPSPEAAHSIKAASAPVGALIEVPLIQLAYGRSGDKGDTANVGIIARRKEYLPILLAQVTEPAVAKYLGHLVLGKVTRYELPGIKALNFVCEQALGGGGMASLRSDPLGKSMAQILLSMPIRVPTALIVTK